MKFSIVIPLYNKELYIGRALSSVRAQTFTDWECIVVDDGSTDRGPDIAASTGDLRIRLVRQKNSGPSAARNRGAREARGDWIALLDADDYWLTDHLQALAGLIEYYPQCGVVGCNFWCEYSDGRRSLANRHGGSQGASIERYLEFNAARKGSLVNTSSTAVCKDYWLKVGGFREAYRLSEDADFWCRLCLHTDFAIWHLPTSVYFQDMSGASTRAALYVGDAPFSDLAPQIPAQRRGAYMEFLAHLRMMALAPGTLLSGEKALVRRMALESFGSSYRARAILLLTLSAFPTWVLKTIYRTQRKREGLPMPSLLCIRRNDSIGDL